MRCSFTCNLPCCTSIVVIRGPDYVEVRPEGVNKGRLSSPLQSLDRSSRGKQHDFVLCIGDDLSDEAMYSAPQVSHTFVVPSFPAVLFMSLACADPRSLIEIC